MMKKKLLAYALWLLVPVLGWVSCSFQHIMSEEEYYMKDKAVIEFDIDWSKVLAAGGEMPSGVTLYFFPNEEAPVDTMLHVVSSNNVEHVTAILPEQDYSVILINQSEREFSNLKFDFSSFDSAYVRMLAEGETPTRAIREDTRGFNAKGALIPGGFSTASVKSARRMDTRGFNAKGALFPTTGVKSLRVQVSAYGMNKSVSVSASVSNLSAGLRLSSKIPLSEPVVQSLPRDMWNVTLGQADNEPAMLKTTFGTFGLARTALHSRAMVEEESLPVILDLVFQMPDKKEARFSIDITEQILSQLNQDEEIPDEGILVEIGRQDDEDGSNHSQEDFITSNGSIVLHHTQEGVNVGVDGWGERDTTIIRF